MIVAVDSVCVCCFICPSWFPHHMWPCLKHAWFIQFGFWTKEAKTVKLFIFTSMINCVFCWEKKSCSIFPKHLLHVGSVQVGLVNEVLKVYRLQVYGLKCESWLILAEVATGVTRVRGVSCIMASTSAPVATTSLSPTFLRGRPWGQVGHDHCHDPHRGYPLLCLCVPTSSYPIVVLLISRLSRSSMLG